MLLEARLVGDLGAARESHPALERPHVLGQQPPSLGQRRLQQRHLVRVRVRVRVRVGVRVRVRLGLG